MTPTRSSLLPYEPFELAWGNLPDSLQAHPGVKALRYAHEDEMVAIMREKGKLPCLTECSLVGSSSGHA